MCLVRRDRAICVLTICVLTRKPKQANPKDSSMQADEIQNAKKFRTQKNRSLPKLTCPDRLRERFCKSCREFALWLSVFHQVKPFRYGHRRDQTGRETKLPARPIHPISYDSWSAIRTRLANFTQLAVASRVQVFLTNGMPALENGLRNEWPSRGQAGLCRDILRSIHGRRTAPKQWSAV